MTSLRGRALARHLTARSSHFVYRCFDSAGTLLYIGCTSDVDRRMAAHRRGDGHNLASQWLSVCLDRYEVDGPYQGRDRGRQAERDAIAAEQPLFNVQERRIPISDGRSEVGRYLVAKGHSELALETTCTCWRETLEAGGFDPWCGAHVAVCELSLGRAVA